METSPKVPVGLMPRARLVELVCCAVVLLLAKPVVDAKFLKAAVVLAQPFIVAAAEVLVKASAVPILLELTPRRVVQPVGNPLPSELKFWR